MRNEPQPAELEAAEAYEKLFVTALFGQWSGKVADAAEIPKEAKVLDVACGTGVLAREVAGRLSGNGSVVGVDPAPGMLAVAARQSPSIEWKQGVAESLPAEDESFDAVVSQFGLMFFEDKGGAIREMLRVLKPEGRISVAVWDSLDFGDAYEAEAALFERVAGREAADAVRFPFSLGDTGELEDLFRWAGAESVEVNTALGRARFPTVRSMVEADLRGWLPVMGVELSEEMIAQVLEEAEHSLGRFRTPGSPVEFPIRAHIVTARKAGGVGRS